MNYVNACRAALPKRGLLASLTLCLLWTALGPNVVQAQQHTPPVERLKALVASDAAFRQTLDSAFANVRDLPDGSPNPWRGKTVEDLYPFLDEWYYFLPNTRNGLDYIMHFSWLYYQNPHGLRVVREEPGLSWTRYFVEQRGAYMDSEASASKVAEWLADPTVRIDEFVVPEEGFRTFNEFFKREVRPGARPVSGVTDPAVVVSPADCTLNMINNDLRTDEQIPTKGRMTLNVAELLGHSEHAARFVGGTAMACFLMPDSYHHYHAPVTGRLVESREHVGHRYFGMDDLPAMANRGNSGYNQDFSVFEQFRHGYFIFETDGHGAVAMIPVGLTTFGSVVFEKPFKDLDAATARPIFKGERLGHFAYGGSLVILLFEPNRLDSVKTRQGQQIGLLH